jgi:hypothetical protein
LILTISNIAVPGETTVPGSTIFLLTVPLIPARMLVSFTFTPVLLPLPAYFSAAILNYQAVVW